MCSTCPRQVASSHRQGATSPTTASSPARTTGSRQFSNRRAVAADRPPATPAVDAKVGQERASAVRAGGLRPVRLRRTMNELVLVNGFPGAGKTTLAKALAGSLDAVLVSKDAVKEAPDTARNRYATRVRRALHDDVRRLAGPTRFRPGRVPRHRPRHPGAGQDSPAAVVNRRRGSVATRARRRASSLASETRTRRIRPGRRAGVSGRLSSSAEAKATRPRHGGT
jgi:hypothetical protein